MSTATRSRKPKGVPVGGQFATEARGESGTTLVADPVETVFTKRYDTLDQKVDAFHTELEELVAGLADDENWHAYLDTMTKFHRYSMFNQMLIGVQNPDATRVAGYRKWEEFGRHVNMGEHGISIFAPKTVRMDVLDSSGNRVLDAKGKPTKQSRCVGFTTATVFDISQTDGDPLPDIDRELTETPPDGFKDDLEAAIAEAGYTVAYENMTGSTDGATSPSTKRVTINASLSPANTAEVLAHELGHIKAGHLERSDEYHTGHGGHRGTMEVEAEAVAYVLCRANGMSTQVGKTASTYVAGWSRENPDTIRESAQKVSTTVKGILSAGSWRNVAAAA